jgi:uncharacterized protein
MKKRILSLLLLLTLVLTLSAAAWADTERFVFDESGYIADGDEEILEDLGATIRANTGVAVCICLTNDTPEDVRAYAADFYDSRIGDGEGIVIIHNPVSGVLAYYFIGEQLQGIGEEELTKIFEAYLSSDTYFEGAKNYMNLVYARLGSGRETIPDERQLDRVADLAGVLSDEQLRELNALADEISETYRCDVAVAFVPSLEGKYIEAYADDFYDYKGYGYGPDKDGILLLVSVGDREFGETTYGYGVTAFTDYGMQHYLEPRFTPYLGENESAGGAEQFIRDAGVLLKQARDGQPYDRHDDPRPAPTVEKKSAAERAPLAAVISAIIGFFSGGIPAGAMKRRMKSVEKNYGAANYARGGLRLRRSDDRFLYANVSKVPVPRESEHRGGGGGSSVHFSSSGHVHGGSHGKF